MFWLIAHSELFFIVLLVFLVLVVEAGFRARRVSTDRHPEVQPALEAARDGMGVLLALLLGFSLPMALPHYEQRIQLVPDEADAINTVAQRAELLPEPARTKILDLLPQYMNARLAFAEAGWDEQATRKAIEHADALQDQMWQETVAAAHQYPTPITATVVQALGTLSNMIEQRRAAEEKHIPGVIWAVFILIATLACFVVGYSMRHRIWLSAVVLPLMVSIVLSLTAELDHSQAGLVTTTQNSMVREQQELSRMRALAP